MAAACLRCPAWAWLKHREGGALAARTAPNQSSCGCLSGLLSGVVCGKEFELDGQSKWEWEAQCSSMRASQIFRSDLLLFMSKHQHPEHYLCSGLAKVKPCFLMMMVWRETHTHTHSWAVICLKSRGKRTHSSIPGPVALRSRLPSAQARRRWRQNDLCSLCSRTSSSCDWTKYFGDAQRHCQPEMFKIEDWWL